MSRLFSFTDEWIQLSAGNVASLVGGPISVVSLMKPVGSNNTMIKTLSTGTRTWEWFRDSTSTFWFPAGFSQGTTTSNAIWQLVAIDFAAGTVTPRYHKVDLEGGSAGVWTHQNGTNTVTAGSGPIDEINFAHGFHFGDMRVAAHAIYGRRFTDLEWETNIGFTSAQSWFNQSPAAMWLLNQAAVSTPVTDVTGGGANEISHTGTSVSADDPPGWSYTITTVPLGALFLPFFP